MIEKIKKWWSEKTDKIYYLPEEYRTHVPPEKKMVDPTTVDPIYEKQLKKEKNISRKLKKTLSSSWN